MPKPPQDPLFPLFRALCTARAEGFLPPLGVLARGLGRRRADVAAVCARLREEGLLDYGRGRRMRISAGPGAGSGKADPHPVPGLPSPPESARSRPARGAAAEALYRDFVDRIERGEYKSGMPLPKVGYLTAFRKVGDRTVREVYERMIREGLASRSGRSFRVGAAANRDPGGRRTPPEAFIILVTRPGRWNHLCRDPHTQEFGLAFLSEARKAGVPLFTALARGPTGADPRSGLAGFEEVAAFLGDSHRATLIVSKREAELPALAAWVRKVSRGGARRVAWLDRAEEGLPGRSAPPFFARFHRDERSAVACALEHLRRQGHLACYYPYSSASPWQMHRLEHLRREAGALGMRIESLDRDALLDWRSREGFARIAYWLRRLDREYRGPRLHVADLIRRKTGLIWKDFPDLPFRPEPWEDGEFEELRRAIFKVDALNPAPESSFVFPLALRQFWGMLALAPCFLDPGLSAIIAPNDFHLHRFISTWLEPLQIQVPGEIAVISFDNEKREEASAWNSVDFGLEGLGYLAFHFLKNDLPVRRGRKGDIPGHPVTVDQGSVAPPPPGRGL